MSQDQVYEFLRGQKVPLMRKQIVEMSGLSDGSVSTALMKMARHGEVEVIRRAHKEVYYKLRKD